MSPVCVWHIEALQHRPFIEFKCNITSIPADKFHIIVRVVTVVLMQRVHHEDDQTSQLMWHTWERVRGYFFLQNTNLLFIVLQHRRVHHNLEALLQFCARVEAFQGSLWYYITETIQGRWSLKPAQLVWLCLCEGQWIPLNYFATVCLNQQVCGIIEGTNLSTLGIYHSGRMNSNCWGKRYLQPQATLRTQINMAAGLWENNNNLKRKKIINYILPNWNWQRMQGVHVAVGCSIKTSADYSVWGGLVEEKEPGSETCKEIETTRRRLKEHSAQTLTASHSEHEAIKTWSGKLSSLYFTQQENLGCPGWQNNIRPPESSQGLSHFVQAHDSAGTQNIQHGPDWIFSLLLWSVSRHRQKKKKKKNPLFWWWWWWCGLEHALCIHQMCSPPPTWLQIGVCPGWRWHACRQVCLRAPLPGVLLVALRGRWRQILASGGPHVLQRGSPGSRAADVFSRRGSRGHNSAPSTETGARSLDLDDAHRRLPRSFLDPMLNQQLQLPPMSTPAGHYASEFTVESVNRKTFGSEKCWKMKNEKGWCKCLKCQIEAYGIQD